MANIIIRDMDDWVIIEADGEVIYNNDRPSRSHDLAGILEELGHTVEVKFDYDEDTDDDIEEE